MMVLKASFDQRRHFEAATEERLASSSTTRNTSTTKTTLTTFRFESISSDGVVHAVSGGSPAGTATTAATSTVAPLRAGVDHVGTTSLGLRTVETTTGRRGLLLLKACNECGQW
ncbi:hypothetical protein Ccrd_018252 [Cynara cardunculus var. scolymus]|uniref:Uncharacterized protein n=1 Tax=Cynara cardunculus var. scolymus TaxID=59895 RepID=A0A103Y6I9_CYNCS|nr:hypothetical protein Ccrd_018252 [Cynara cardunculus var. scolymus]